MPFFLPLSPERKIFACLGMLAGREPAAEGPVAGAAILQTGASYQFFIKKKIENNSQHTGSISQEDIVLFF